MTFEVKETRYVYQRWNRLCWRAGAAIREDSAPVEEYDLKCYEEAMKDYREDPVTYSLDEVEQELGLR